MRLFLPDISGGPGRRWSRWTGVRFFGGMNKGQHRSCIWKCHIHVSSNMGMEGEYVVIDGDTVIQYLISYIDTTSMAMVLVW